MPDTPTIAAESASDQLHAALSEARQELDALRSALDAAERRRHIERALIEEGAIDLETTALLAEPAVTSTDPAALPAAAASAASDLKRRKPFLFARRPPRSSAMAPISAPSKSESLALSRQAAVTSGDRADLLRYLRLRRSA